MNENRVPESGRGAIHGDRFMKTPDELAEMLRLKFAGGGSVSLGTWAAANYSGPRGDESVKPFQEPRSRFVALRWVARKVLRRANPPPDSGPKSRGSL